MYSIGQMALGLSGILRWVQAATKATGTGPRLSSSGVIAIPGSAALLCSHQIQCTVKYFKKANAAMSTHPNLPEVSEPELSRIGFTDVGVAA